MVNVATLPMHTAQTNDWLFGSLEGTSLLDSHKINTSSLENYFVLFSTNFQYPYDIGKFKYVQLIFTHIWQTECGKAVMARMPQVGSVLAGRYGRYMPACKPLLLNPIPGSRI